MSYYYCSSCDKRIEFKHKKSHLKSKLHMNTEGTVINKYTIINPELREINNILIKHVNNYDKRFEVYKVVCKWKLVFDTDTSTDVKSKVMYKISVLRHNLENYIKNKVDFYRKQRLKFSHISEMNIAFRTSLDFMTSKHYME